MKNVFQKSRDGGGLAATKTLVNKIWPFGTQKPAFIK
jgi:hypothetical protein